MNAQTPITTATVEAWAARTGHFHIRERTEDSFACAQGAMALSQHLANLSPERRAQLNQEFDA